KLAIAIGFFQCLAMIPGTSRSGATIIGALLLGVSRGVAAEFSFFLAIPTMAGATLLKLVKNGVSFTPLEWQLLILGMVVSFLVAYIVIKWFMGYIRTKTFKVFGYYRVAVGILVLLMML
ncbi:MAG: undecaprenyl-diphosphate phosphatase, partial [Fusobacteriaceae bacterium]